MNTLLANAAQILFTGLKSVGGETVTYKRGNDTIDGLSAVPVRTRHDDVVGGLLDTANITAREQDFIIAADSLAISGQFILPQRNDVIEWTDARGVRRTFRVLPRTGDRTYRFTDQTRQIVRVYTVEMNQSGE